MEAAAEPPDAGQANPPAEFRTRMKDKRRPGNLTDQLFLLICSIHIVCRTGRNWEDTHVIALRMRVPFWEVEALRRVDILLFTPVFSDTKPTDKEGKQDNPES